MKIAVLILPTLFGCTPLAGYVHVYPGVQSALGTSQVAEAYARVAEIERLEAGYPYERFPRFSGSVQPCRKAFEGPTCPEASR
jgi:hypothetical protein